MGIPSLNYYLRTACPEAIKTTHLSYFKGKRLVIDTSIYLYRFKGNGTITENMYIMCSLFKKYGIIPIFIFDGAPPREKYETIKQRSLKKYQAEEEYLVMKEQLQNIISKQKRSAIMVKMKLLEKKFIRVKNKDIRNVKLFLKAYGVDYILAEGEADILCAKMVIDGKADACLSDDMDLFVHGCPYVLRYLNLTKKTVSSYHLKTILEKMDISIVDFRQLCILTGTDYSIKNNRKTFCYYYKLYKRFKATKEIDFTLWLSNNNILIDAEVKKLKSVELLFDINSIQIPEGVINTNIDSTALQKILECDQFIFPPT